MFRAPPAPGSGELLGRTLGLDLIGEKNDWLGNTRMLISCVFIFELVVEVEEAFVTRIPMFSRRASFRVS